MLDSIIVDSPCPADTSVIWMHGLGADGNDFAPVVPYLNIPKHCSIRFVFPHAPVRPVTVNMGMRMRAWYDITNPVIGTGTEDENGIIQTAAQIKELIHREEQSGIPSDRIVLAGFSQGGAMALYEGIRFESELSGIVAISTYLPLPAKTADQRHKSNHNIPILYLHGTFDPVISIQVAQQSRQMLTDLGYDVSFSEYPVQHTVSPEQLTAIGQWLTQRAEAAH